MATKRDTSRRVRDLPAEVQLEIARARAGKLAAEVKIAEGKQEKKEHQATIDKLKGE